jgi:DNA polymerase-3 subunit alpha
LPSYKIKSVKNLGVQRTIDITVNSENHIYYANGIATSNSHSVGYALTGYWTAWVKAHLPHHYICGWLRNAKNEQKPLEEIRAMVSEARRLSIKVLPPSIINLPHTDFFIKNKAIYFGLDSIKGCGEKSTRKLIDLDIDFEEVNWIEFLVNYSGNLNKTQLINMIRVGCFDYTEKGRTLCEFEYLSWASLTKSLQKKAKEIYNESTPLTLRDLFVELLSKAITSQKANIQALIDLIDKPPSSTKDSIDNIVSHEKELMGINISCSRITKGNIPESKNSTKDVEKSTTKDSLVIVGEISEYREIKIKNGKMVGQYMASFIITDESGQADCVIFPRELDYYQGALYDSNIIMIEGQKSNRGGLIINKIYEV